MSCKDLWRAYLQNPFRDPPVGYISVDIHYMVVTKMIIYTENRGHLELHRMVVWFTTTCTCIQIMCNQCLSPLRLLVREPSDHHSWRGVLDTTACGEVCQWLPADWWFSPGIPVSSINKTDRHHDITELFLKVALNTTTLSLTSQMKPQSL
jgi:hypothetical protein